MKNAEKLFIFTRRAIHISLMEAMWQRKHLCMNISLQHLVQDKSIMHVYTCVYLYICVFVYVYFYLCICILTWIHYCNIWCRIRENIKHHSLIFSTQYSIYANLCKSESHHSRSQYIASKRLSFSPALTFQVCVRYDKSFLPEHFAQLHNLRYVATSEIYSQKYTHTSQKCTEITITEYPLTKHLVMSKCVTNDT